MRANAQRDGRPEARAPENVHYTVYQPTRRPNIVQSLVWLPLSDVAAVTKPRRDSRWNLLGYPKLTKRSQPLVGRSSPYCEACGEILLLNKFFPIVDMCLSCEDIARQSSATVPRWRIFGDFLRPILSASRVQHVSDLHLKFALRPQDALIFALLRGVCVCGQKIGSV